MKSKDYWRKREREHMAAMMKLDKSRGKELERLYKQAQKDIQKEIDRFYSIYAGKENIDMAEARKRVSQHDVQAFQEKAKEYVKNKDFSPRANEELRVYNLTMRVNRLEMLKAEIGLELTAMSNEEVNTIKKFLKQQIQAEFRRQAGILGLDVIRNDRLINTIINASFYNATFSDRIWNNHTALKSQLDKLLTNGLVQGKNPRELARGLRKEFDVGTYESERLMRTETARAQTDAQIKAFEEYGFTECEYIAESSACDTCADMDGKILKVSDLQPGVSSPPLHPNCLCSLSSYVDRKAWEDGLAARGL